MTNTAATILIPDISGFTQFMTNTELSHGSFAISILINAIIDAVGDEYEISEIEGDAVLMFKRGAAPSPKDVENTCLKIFNAFHLQRKWMQQHAVCPCKACKEISNLTLKFVAHHGPVGEIKAGRFSKLSGREVIVAHRLLKNNVPSDEYLLLTEKLLQHADESPEIEEMELATASEEYSSIGKVDYRFALLNEKRKRTPEPPKPETDYQTDSTPYSEIPIAVNYQDAYMVMMNIPGRNEWMDGLQKVEQDVPNVFVGSIHYCTFDDYVAVVSPLRMTISEEEIFYAESCRIEEKDMSVVHEFIFKNVDDKDCVFAWRFLDTGKSPLPDENRNALVQRLKQMASNLKDCCEKTNSN
jgi:hypothetical protein